MAVRLAHQCPPDAKAYSVGCVIVSPENELIETGFSREWGRCHAEQSAIAKVENPEILVGADLYSTMEPCTARDSHPEACANIIIRHRIGRVFVAVAEPPNFKDCTGYEKLAAAGIQVIHMPAFERLAMAPNRHIVAPSGAAIRHVCRHS